MTYEEFEQLMEEFNLTTTKNFRWAGYLIENNKLGQKVATGIAGFRPPLNNPDEEHPWKDNAVIIFDHGLFNGDFATDVEHGRVIIGKRLMMEKQRRYQNRLYDIERDFKK
jgi:hypothetical protein